MRRLFSLTVPEVPILVGATLLLSLASLHGLSLKLAEVYPFAVLAAALILGWRFNRSRLVFAIALLALAEYVLSGGLAPARQRYLYHATTLLLPVNLALVGLLPERGTFTSAGLARWGVLVLEILAVLFFGDTALIPATTVLRTHVVPAAWTRWTLIGQPAIIAFAASATLLVVAWWHDPRSPVRGYAYALIAVFTGLSWRVGGPGGPGRTIWFATAGLVLVVAVVEASYVMAYHDALTDLPGRRALNEALLRLSGQFTIAMIDVDHFKQFNDRHGHDAGDQVLRMVAARLAAVNGGGKAYRYGGEEFAVVFPGKGVEETLPHLEELREEVAAGRFTLRRRLRPRKRPTLPKAGGKTQVVVTVSIGAAETNHRHPKPEQVVQAADQALYRAKDAGRNRVSN
jgi:diguanylate cyclase (GGDEF)-like protein